MGLGGFKGRAPRTCSLGDNTALLSKILITTLGFRPDPLGGRGTTWCGDLHWTKSARDKEPQDQEKAKAFQCPKKPARATKQYSKEPSLLSGLRGIGRAAILAHICHNRKVVPGKTIRNS